jgi:FtsH-binding integral membrane protein
VTSDAFVLLLLLFCFGGALAFVLVRLFAEASRRHGARVLSTFERAAALGTGPIEGIRTRMDDDGEVRRLLLLHSPNRGIEALRLLAWAAIGVALCAFLVLTARDPGSFWIVLGTLAACFWVLEAVLAISRHDRGHARRSAIIAGLFLVGVTVIGGWRP